MSSPKPNPADFSQNARKQETRIRTLEVVKQCPRLWANGKLLVDWMELSGVGEPSLVLLLEGGALDSRRFYGISRDEKVIQPNREKFASEIADKRVRYFQGELEYEITDLDAYRGLGVLVFDGFTSVTNRNLIHGLACLFTFARHKAMRQGQAVLVTNLVVPPWQNPDKALDRYNDFLTRTIGIDVPADHFESYKGDGRVHPMLLHRVIINAKGVEVPPPQGLPVTVWNI